MPLPNFDATKVKTPSCHAGELCEVWDRQFRRPDNISLGVCRAPGLSLQPIYTAQLSLEEASAQSQKIIQKIDTTREVLKSAIEVSHLSVVIIERCLFITEPWRCHPRSMAGHERETAASPNLRGEANRIDS
jgi:hypothetical protein